MEYDYTGMRVKKNAPSGISLYPFQGYEIDPNGIITKFIKIGIETFASRKRTSGGAVTYYFYHNDHLGGVNVITDIAGTQVQLNEYDPWGSVSRAVGSIDPTRRFNGKELDPETGLYYYGGRYYDPEISRFISPDPFIPQASNPQSLNRYSYTLNNPQNYIDPSGYFFKKLFKSIGKAFKKLWNFTKKAWTAVLSNPIGRIFLAGVFAVATYGAFTAVTGAAFSGTVAAVTGASSASAQAVMEIPPIRIALARAGIGATIGVGLLLNAGFQLAYGAAFTQPTEIISKAEASPDQLVKALDIAQTGGGTNYAPTVQPTLDDVSKLILSKGDVVGVIGAENTVILGLIKGQHSAALFGNLNQMKEILYSPHQMYGVWGTSHQAVSATFLEAGFRGTILRAGIGILRYPTSLIYGPYGGGAILNPVRYLQSRDE